jgi:predicted nucleic acid-binding protein
MSFFFLEATAFARLFVREPGTEPLIRLMESVEDNRKLISAATPLEVYAAIRRRERAGNIAPEAAITALELLRVEAARMVQQPLNPGVLEAARQLLDRTTLRWPEALQLGAALAARDMFPGTRITFVSASASLLDAARAEGLDAIDPAKLPAADTAHETEAAKETYAGNQAE